MGNEEKVKVTLAGDLNAGVKPPATLPMPEGIKQNNSLPVDVNGQLVIGPALNITTDSGLPFRFSLMGGVQGDSSYTRAGNITWGQALEAQKNPSDPMSQSVEKAFQLTDNAAQGVVKFRATANQDGWVQPGLNGGIEVTGTQSLGHQSSLGPINTLSAGADFGGNILINNRANCYSDARFLNLGVTANKTIFSGIANDPNKNLNLGGYVGVSNVFTGGGTLYGQVGVNYTPVTKDYGLMAKLGIRF